MAWSKTSKASEGIYISTMPNWLYLVLIQTANTI